MIRDALTFVRGLMHTRRTMPIEPVDEKLYTVKEVAERLGLTRFAVIARIKRKSIIAQKYGRDWLVKESDLLRVVKRGPGRPKKDLTK